MKVKCLESDFAWFTVGREYEVDVCDNEIEIMQDDLVNSFDDGDGWELYGEPSCLRIVGFDKRAKFELAGDQ